MAQEKICGIYCIENLINGKKYIGSSKNIYHRWKQHIFNLNGNIHINDHLQSSWNKYGKDNFTFYIIEKCLQDELCDREKYYISKFNTTNNKHGYNMTSGGDGICNLREECVDKIMDMDEYDLVNLIKNIICKCPPSMKVILKY